MCPRFHSQCTQIVLVFRSHTGITNLFTNAVFSSPEVKFQVYGKLKYGEQKSIKENFLLVKVNHKECVEQIKICYFESNASRWSIIVFVSTGLNMKIQVN